MNGNRTDKFSFLPPVGGSVQVRTRLLPINMVRDEI